MNIMRVLASTTLKTAPKLKKPSKDVTYLERASITAPVAKSLEANFLFEVLIASESDKD